VTEVETLMGQSATLLSPTTAMQAAALGIGSPTAANVNAAWAGDTNVQSAFNTAASVQGLANFNLTEASGGSVFSELTFAENASHLNSQDLLVGWLNPTILGGGVQNGSLSLEIDRQGVAIFSETFTSNSAIQSFFHNTVLDLGPENPNINSGQVNFEFKFDFSSSSANAGLYEGLAFGTSTPVVPEPSTSVLLALGAFGLLCRAVVLRRRNRG
jgi:hypothetical protein